MSCDGAAGASGHGVAFAVGGSMMPGTVVARLGPGLSGILDWVVGTTGSAKIGVGSIATS